MGRYDEVIGRSIRFRPIDRWPKEETDERRPSRFRASFSATLDLLERELDMIDAERPLIQMDLTESEIRLDGYPYASARPETPRVIVSFEMDGEPYQYACDTWDDWQDNLRAIALTLEKLRAVDRYGVTKRGEQYRGWRALPGSGQTTTTMGSREAAVELAKMTEYDADELLEEARKVDQAFRRKAKWAHPDQGGDEQEWLRIMDARKVLTRHHGAPA